MVQVRGSIPLLWEQIVDLSYKPQLKVINSDQTVYVYSNILLFTLLELHNDFWLC